MNARKGIIEWLEDNINEDKQRGLTDTAIMYQNTLNLIEKQQAEIEKKDKQLKGLEEIDKRLILNESYFRIYTRLRNNITYK